MLDSPPSILIAGTKSGCGKTTLSLGLMAALRERGLDVAPFKVGPDFIDPGLHEVICKRPSYNLDTWMNRPSIVRKTFSDASKGSDISIIEGVMGLFDSATGEIELGSSAHVAKVVDAPVLLVIDAKSMARSVCALLKGFLEFDRELRFLGAIFNNVSSSRHKRIIEEAIKDIKLSFFGFLPLNKDLKIPSRHLGLHTGLEAKGYPDLFKRLSRFIEENLHVEGLLDAVGIKIRRESTRLKPKEKETDKEKRPKAKGGPKIVIFYDKAFCFYYQRNIDLLREFGARIQFFSALMEECLPEDIHGIYIGGGYPELYAFELSSKKALKGQIKALFEKGIPILSECGGFMFLCQGIHLEKRFYEWAGLFPLRFKMEKRFQALGYRKVVLKRDCVIGKKGDTILGHEFRYSRPEKDENDAFSAFDSRGEKVATPGFIYKNAFSSYIHLHFDSNWEIVKNFLAHSGDFQKSA